MEIILTTVVWVAISALIRAIQKRYEVSNRILLIVFAIVAWTIYQLFVTFVPWELQQSIIQFIVAILGTAVWVHEFIARPFLDKEPIQLNLLKKWTKTESVTETIQEKFELQWPINEEEEMLRWGAEEREEDDDWIVWEDKPNQPQITLEDLPPAKNNFITSWKIQYHQTKEMWKNTCTLASSVWAISDLISKRASAEELQEIVKEAIPLWFSHDRWWYTTDGTEHVRKMINKLRNKNLVRLWFRMSDTKTVEKVQSLWYTIVVWYRWGKWYNTDRDTDGEVTKLHTDNTYWHLLRMFWSIIDNYFWRKYNIYQNDVIQEMLQNGTWHKYGYIYVDPDQEPETSDTEKWRANFKTKVKAFREQREKTHSHMRIKWPIVNWPKWIDNKSTFQQKDGKEFVIYKWERHEIIKRR